MRLSNALKASIKDIPSTKLYWNLNEEEKSKGDGRPEREKNKAFYAAKQQSDKTLDQLAKETGVGKTTLSRYASQNLEGDEPRARVPRLAHAVKVAKALGSSPEELFGTNIKKSEKKIAKK